MRSNWELPRRGLWVLWSYMRGPCRPAEMNTEEKQLSMTFRNIIQLKRLNWKKIFFIWNFDFLFVFRFLTAPPSKYHQVKFSLFLDFSFFGCWYRFKNDSGVVQSNKRRIALLLWNSPALGKCIWLYLIYMETLSKVLLAWGLGSWIAICWTLSRPSTRRGWEKKNSHVHW